MTRNLRHRYKHYRFKHQYDAPLRIFMFDLYILVSQLAFIGLVAFLLWQLIQPLTT